MKAHQRRIPISLLAGLILIVPAAASAQALTTLSTLPGLTQPQAAVGGAIDSLCPKLAATQSSLSSSQLDLLKRCSDMKANGLGTVVLPDVLGSVTSEQTAAQGTSAIETRSTQFRAVGARLSALRLGATGIAFNGLKLDFDGKSVTADRSTGPQDGSGASADTDASGRLGAFVNGVGSFGSKDTTANEVGFDFHDIGITAGVDYRITESLVAGLAFSYLRTNADFAFALGDVDTNSYGLSLYGTYYVGQFYADVLTGFTWNQYDMTRRIEYAPGPGAGAPIIVPGTDPNPAVNRTATADTDGQQFTLNVGAGYDFRLGGSTLTPYGRLEYVNLHIDSYTEQGADGLNLKVRSQTVQSLLSVLGGRVSHAFSTPFAVLVPQIRGEWRHELLNNDRSIEAQFASDPFNTLFSIPTDNPDRDFFAVGAAISAVFKKGVAAFVDFETVLGLRDVTSYNFTAGLRIQF